MMEQTQTIKDTYAHLRKWECIGCGGLLGLPEGREPITNTCTCGKKAWKFIGAEFTPEEWELEKSSFKYIYNGFYEVIGRYVDMPDNYKKICALWCMATYAITEFTTFPFLFFNAMRGSGKTRTITICSHLACKGNGKVFTGITEAGLFRSEPYSTLVLDECEKITTKEAQNLREYLQASYKSSATVMRAVKKRVAEKETYVIEEFKPFRPIIMANINGMDEVLGDRCITIPLESSVNTLVTRIIEDFDSNPQIKQMVQLMSNKQCSYVDVCRLKNTIKEWNTYIYSKICPQIPTPTYTTTLPTLTYKDTLDDLTKRTFDKLYDTGINGRNLELVFPLIIAARAIDENLVDEILPILVEIVNNKRTEQLSESKDISLIQFVAEKTSSWNEYLSIKGLTQQYREYIGWTTDEDWCNPTWLGRALTRLQLYSSKKRVAHGIEVMLLPTKAQEMLKRFKVKETKEDEGKEN